MNSIITAETWPNHGRCSRCLKNHWNGVTGDRKGTVTATRLPQAKDKTYSYILYTCVYPADQSFSRLLRASGWSCPPSSPCSNSSPATTTSSPRSNSELVRPFSSSPHFPSPAPVLVRELRCPRPHPLPPNSKHYDANSALVTNLAQRTLFRMLIQKRYCSNDK